MKNLISTILMLIILILSSCSKRTNTVTTPDNVTPTIIADEQNIFNNRNKEDIYGFDATKEWDVTEYTNKYGMELNYFSSPIDSPNIYTYKSKDNANIDEIAYELGNIMMKDFMRDYEGKTFTVTEFRNLTAHVLNEDEFKEWEERYSKLGKHVELNENQWLCTYACEYRYTGIFSGIGEMPVDLEWIDTLLPDGSGENYVFIIQKINDEEYIMRALPKAILELKRNG